MRSPFAHAAALLALLLGGCGRSTPAVDPESAAAAFFAKLSRGDTKGAYESAAFGFQAAQTLEAFQSNAEELGFVGAQPPVWTQAGTHGNQSDLSGVITNREGKAFDLSATMVRDGREWKLNTLRTGKSSGGGSENPFTLVGKGSDFKDVYHQPMPSTAELKALAQGTMKKFADAIQKKGFEDLYRYTAQEWRNGTLPVPDASSHLRSAGDRPIPDLAPDNRVTVALLQSHFGPFIDSKVDLEPLAKSEPIFDEPPRIDSNGFIKLAGHFEGAELRANFVFRYVYELPRWKLCEINVSVLRP